jgi:hypothetical protein
MITVENKAIAFLLRGYPEKCHSELVELLSNYYQRKIEH